MRILRRLPSRVWLGIFLAFGAVLAGGCGTLYTNTREPYSYRAQTPSDVKAEPSDPVVHGRACEYYLFYLFNWGNCGYAQVTKGVVKDSAHEMIYDPKFDETIQSWLLGLYIRQCWLMTARVGHI